ncbi:hypothetical protein GH714_023607 [Hevea brasiliensis]|uniref:Uncharacterized protein n=1 Tax=Hevea brasiliensis TaxID=3981 RepID=A0A6A6LK62_HEVBR|nr:hypothetical protein GH714_023607 [Hevea brasiliensis]
MCLCDHKPVVVREHALIFSNNLAPILPVNQYGIHLQLDDGLELSFTGKRRFAKVCLLKEVQPTSVPPISELGPDALLEPMKVDEFNESLHKKEIAIKALLLDQVKTQLICFTISKIIQLEVSMGLRSNNNLDKEVITTFAVLEDPEVPGIGRVLFLVSETGLQMNCYAKLVVFNTNAKFGVLLKL